MFFVGAVIGVSLSVQVTFRRDTSDYPDGYALLRNCSGRDERGCE